MGKKSAQIRNKVTSSPTASPNEAEVRTFKALQRYISISRALDKYVLLLVTFILTLGKTKAIFEPYKKNMMNLLQSII
jgi:hypothetical protein